MRSLIVGLIAIIFFSFPEISFAQPGGGGPDGGAEPSVPITGIEILLGVGAIFGAKKLLDARKKSR